MNTTTLDQALVAFAQSLPAVHLPGSPGYAAAVAPWNVAVSQHPVAVVDATTADDVAAAVRFAQDQRLQVSVQATGHGASSDLEGVLLVSTRLMTDLELHAEAGWVRVQAGVRWEQVLEAGAPHGLAGLAGSAPGVGVVGYLTGGGVGPLARTHGLASDRVRAFEVVTGDGQIRRTTPTEHPALFWALRGGKGLLGIVTAVELDLLPIAEIYGGAVYFDGQDAREVLQRWATWCPTLLREATTSVALLRLPAMPGVPEPLAGRLSVAVRFAFTDSATDGEQALAPMRAAATPLIDTVAVMPYAALGSIHADPVDPMPTHEEHALLGSLPSEAVDRLLETAGPEADCPQVIVELRQLGGAIAAGSPVPSAFCSRDAAYSLLTIGIGVPPVVGAVEGHATALIGSLDAWTVPGGLPNFAPRPGAAWLRCVYQPAVLERLRRLSEAYDPERVILGTHALHEGELVPDRPRSLVGRLTGRR